MKTGRDIEVFRVVCPQKTMTHGEVEHHEIDVELEVRGRANAVEYFRGGHQLEIDNLSIALPTTSSTVIRSISARPLASSL